MRTPRTWKVKPLSDVVEIQRGFDLPHHARKPGSYPVLTAGETGGFHNEGPVKGPGVTIGRATNLGKPKWSDVDFWPHNTTMFVKDFKGNNRRWVYHLFEATDLSGFDSGSVQPMLNRNYIAQVPVQVPPVDEQHAIAKVLGAFDDKITANTKMVETLESVFMAHWNAIIALESSDTAAVDSLVSAPVGGDWGTAEATEDSNAEVFCIRGADIANLQRSSIGNMPRRFLKPSSLRRRQLVDGDLVVEMSGGSPTQSTGRVVLATGALLARLELPLVSSNFCKFIRPRDPEHSFYLYGLLRESWRKGEFFPFENGSTGIKNLAFSDYCSTKIVNLPPAKEIKKFNELARSIFESIQAVGLETSRLRSMRNALLPQLMSGKLRVSDVETLFDSVM